MRTKEGKCWKALRDAMGFLTSAEHGRSLNKCFHDPRGGADRKAVVDLAEDLLLSSLPRCPFEFKVPAGG